MEKKFFTVSVFLLSIFFVFSISSAQSSAIQEKINSFTDDFHKNQTIIKEIIGHGKEALPFLIKALQHTNENIRGFSAQALGDYTVSSGIKSEEIFQAALNRLAFETDGRAKANRIYILDVFNDIRALPILAQILEKTDDEEDIRYRAAYAIARFDDPKIFPILKKFIHDKQSTVRNTAIWGLGNSKNQDAVNLLLPMWNDKKEPLVLRYWVGTALQALGKEVDLDIFKKEFEKKFLYQRTTSEYLLKTDISEKALDDIEKNMKLAYEFNKKFFKTEKKIKNTKTTILVFKSEDDFRDYAELYYPDFSSSGGGYIPSEDFLFTYNRPDYEHMLKLIRHEWTHRFMGHYVYKNYWEGESKDFFKAFPVWFDEGFAEYVSYIDLKNGEPTISTEYAADIAERVNKGTLGKIRELVEDEDPYKFVARYSEYWGLVYFLLHGKEGKYLNVVEKMIDAMKSGHANINQLFLQNINDAQFQTEWQAFIKKKWENLRNTEAVISSSGNAKCTDSDAKDLPAARGTLTSSDPSVFWHNYSDYCIDEKQLVEMKCAVNSYSFEYVDCSLQGAICTEGACVKKNGANIQNTDFRSISSESKPKLRSPNSKKVRSITPPKTVVENLQVPWEIIFLPDGHMLISQRPGKLVKIDPTNPAERTAIIEVEGVSHISEGGLLGATLHPKFKKNKWLYIYLTSKNPVEGGFLNRVERYRFENDKLTKRKIIIDNIPGAKYHDGGRIAFGPDGFLYITTGDAENPDFAQDKNSLAGKILRVKDDGSIPPDNPFKNAVYSYGHRNPQGLTWDEKGRLWSTEHGPSGIPPNSGQDELNLIEKGANYGWPVIKGKKRKKGMKVPVIQSGVFETWAPASAVYMNGSIFFGGLRGETLYEAKITEKGKAEELKKHFKGKFGRLRTVVLGPDGYLYISTSNTDGRGDARMGDDKIIRVYTKNL